MIGQTLGHYRILEKLGSGGMGVVYRARDEQLERDVAVKVLPSGALTDESARRHFRKEALALAKLNHANIETVYEFGSQDGTDFLVLEYVSGQTLAQKLAGGPLPEKDVIALAMQIAAALEEAHERGIVHRDLKPANIAITARGEAKVLDFGLAKLLHLEQDLTTDRLTETRGAPGTVPFMSPEQLRGEAVDGRSDIFALGAVLYQMATGRRAFPGQLISQITDDILHRQPVSPRVLNERISGELEHIILKCLEKDSELRYQSAKELLADLRRLAASSSVNVRAPSGRPTTWKRRQRLAFASVGLGVLGFAIAAVAMNLNGLRNRLVGRAEPLRIRSIAVLPLVNVSGDPQEDYFADGVTDELITDLAQIGQLRVISRTSVVTYKGAKKPLPQIAKELGVDAVVEGSVQRAGNRVRINAELIQAASDRHLWAKSYERDLRDILTLQGAVAKAIVNEVQVKLTPQEEAQLDRTQTVNPEAHEAYLAGRFYWNKRTAEGLNKSIAFFQQAIAKDPGYAVAYAGLADAYHAQPELTTETVDEASARAKAAALKALELDNSLAEAHSAIARVKEDYEWDWSGAEQQYKQAIALNPGLMFPHFSYSHLLLELGRMEEALAEARLAQQLDPLGTIANDNLAAALYYAGQYDQAVEQCLKTLDIDSASPQAHRHLGLTYTQKQLYPEATTEFKEAIELSHGSPEALAELGYAFGISGQKAKARETLQELMQPARGHVSEYRLAIVYMGLGENENALKSLEHAVDERLPGVVLLKVSPLFRELRDEERFRNLLIHIGLDRAELKPVTVNGRDNSLHSASGHPSQHK